jgi:hypothetical protein
MAPRERWTMAIHHRALLPTHGGLQALIVPVSATTDAKVIQAAAKYNRPEVQVAVVAHDQSFAEALLFFVSQFPYNAEIIGHASLENPDAD